MLRVSPLAKRMVMLCDRDAIDAKAYSRPIDPTQPVSWDEILAMASKVLGKNLTEKGLTSRYQLGAVVLESYAVVNGHLNVKGYNSQCLGPDGSNPVRHEGVHEAQGNDLRIKLTYQLAYPEDKLCRVANHAMHNFNEKVEEAIACVWKEIKSM